MPRCPFATFECRVRLARLTFTLNLAPPLPCFLRLPASLPVAVLSLPIRSYVALLSTHGNLTLLLSLLGLLGMMVRLPRRSVRH